MRRIVPLAVAALVLSVLPQWSAAQAKRPNILFIMADEHTVIGKWHLNHADGFQYVGHTLPE